MEVSYHSLLDGSSNSTVACLDLQSVLREEVSTSAEEGAVMSRPVVVLENNQLWKQFHRITNEMTVTKSGRRMFPLLCVQITNLDPHATYTLLLGFKMTHSHRWRFINREWHPGNAVADPPDQRHVYIHPKSPASGVQWMQEPVTFSKLKLSNKENGNSKIKVRSLHKYQPYIHIVKLTNCKGSALLHEKKLSVTSHTFVETQFIAVTAYQNDKLTQLKIRHNPFAKAFLGSQESHREEQQFNESTTVPLSNGQHLLSLPPINIPVHFASRTDMLEATNDVPSVRVSMGHHCSCVPTYASDMLNYSSSYPQTNIQDVGWSADGR